MKKTTSFILLASLLISLVPVLATPSVATVATTETHTVPAMVNPQDQTETADETLITGYNDLYVKEGLIGLFDAFDNTNTSKINLATGKWYNQVDDGDTAATIQSATAVKNNVLLPSWYLGASGGVSYDQTIAQWEMYRLETGIILSDAFPLPAEDYTFETVLQARGFSVDGVRTTGTPFALQTDGVYKNFPLTWGTDATRVASIGLGPLKGIPYRLGNPANPPTPHIHADSLILDFIYQDNYNGAPAFWGSRGAAYTFAFQDAIDSTNHTQVSTTSFAVTHDFVSTQDYTYRFFTNTESTFTDGAGGQNGAEGFTRNTAKSNYQPNTTYQAYKASTHGTFNIMHGMAGTIYAIRVYDRVLTQDELAINHMADLLAYHKIDLATYKHFFYNANLKSLCAEALASLTFDTTKETVEATLDDFFANNLSLLKTTYDKLYVTDGLTVLLSAYSEDDASLSLENGTWQNKVASGTIAIDGGAYHASTNPTGWRLREGGGFGYDVNRAGVAAGSAVKNKINLGLDNLPSGDFTVEQILTNYTASTAPGVRDTFAGDYYNFNGMYTKFGAWGQWMYRYNVFRVQYDDGLWGHGATWYNWYSHNMFAQACPIAQTQTNEDKNTHAVGKMYKNGTLAYTIDLSTATNSTNGALITPSNYTAANAGSFYTAQNGATTMFALRVYNRILSDAEIKQNHFVDIAGYFALDVSDYKMATSAEKTEVHNTFAGYTFEGTATDAQQVLDDILASPATLAKNLLVYEGISARLSGNAGIRAIFSVDTCAKDKLEAQGYKVAFGAVMGVGEENGALVNTQETLIVSGNMDNGFTATTSGTTASVIYQTDNKNYATNAYLDPQTQDAFAYATTCSDTEQNAAYYAKGFVYRGFVAYSKDGTTEVVYRDGANELFGTENALYGVGASISEVADYFVNVYEEDVFNAYSYHANPLLSSILTTSNITKRDYTPGTQADILLNLYVSPSGNDAVAGTVATAPLQTIQMAFQKAKAVLGSTQDSVMVTIHLASGRYEVPETLTLSGSEITAEDYYINIKGSEGAVLSGAVEFADGIGIGENKMSMSIDDPYCTYQFEADENGEYPVFRNLLINGNLATLAHQGVLTQDEGGTQYKTDSHFASSSNGKIYLDAAAFEDFASSGEVSLADKDILLMIEAQWEFKAIHIDRVDFADTDSHGNVAVYLDPVEWAAYSGNSMLRDQSGRIFWLENALEFLDTPGEYYYDKEQGKLYYKKTTAITHAAYASAEKIFAFDNLKNVAISGVTFEGTDYYRMMSHGNLGGQAGHIGGVGMPTEAAVYGYNMENFAVFDCVFRALCMDGVSVRGAVENFDVVGNIFRDIGGTGIRVGTDSGVWSNSNKNEDIRLHDNNLERVAWYNRSSPAIFVNVANGCEITHNTIKDCSYSGISVGWAWAERTLPLTSSNYALYHTTIAYNHISDFMTDMADGAAIYTLGGNAWAEDDRFFNTIHHNYIHVTSKVGNGISSDNGLLDAHANCIYHDGSSSNWFGYDNVINNEGGHEIYVYYYFQHITNQEVYNIYVEDTYFVCDGRPFWQTKCKYYFKNFTSTERNVDEDLTKEYDHYADLPASAKETAQNAGSGISYP